MTPLQQKILNKICVFLEVDDCDCSTCKKAKTVMLNSITEICIEESISELRFLKPKIFDSDSLYQIDQRISELQNQLNNLK